MNRRDYLGILSGGATYSIAGCVTVPDQRVRENERTQSRQRRKTKGKNQQQKITHPGEPKRMKNGRLPVYSSVEVVNSKSKKFQSGLGHGDKNVSVDENSARISFLPEHSGRGRASGYATGTYQTAWTAPETGKYQLKANFHRWGEFYYNLPPDGSVMTSFDVNAQIVNYDRSRVVASQKFPQSLQSSTKRISNELGEFLIETGVTVLISYSLGLSVVARLVLGRIVDELIELENTGGRGSDYDVAAILQREPNPLNIGGPFKVTEETTIIFEISPMLSWCYELNDFQMNPRFDVNFDFEGFWVKQLE